MEALLTAVRAVACVLLIIGLGAFFNTALGLDLGIHRIALPYGYLPAVAMTALGTAMSILAAAVSRARRNRRRLALR